MKAISQREFNSINLISGIVILLCVFYVGYRLSINKSNSQPRSTVVVEAPLQTKLTNGYGIANLGTDLAIINRSINQQHIDQMVANRSFMGKSKIISNPFNSSIIAKQEIERRLTLVTQMSSELNAVRHLSESQSNLLNSNIGLIGDSLNSLEKDLKDRNSGIVISQLNSQFTIFNETQIQVALVKVADDQQINEYLLSQLSDSLNQAISVAKTQGLAVTNFQADLTTLDSDETNSLIISKSVENSLAVSNFNGISSLTNDSASLDSANRDILAALNAARTIINSLIAS